MVARLPGSSGVDYVMWSPFIANRQSVHGRWTNGTSTLELFPNGTFRIDARGDVVDRVQLTRTAGRWELEDWKLTLDPGDRDPRRLRVVVSNGAYRIIEEPFDIDTWPRWRGFNRSPASPAPDQD